MSLLLLCQTWARCDVSVHMKVAKRFEFCTASAFGDARLKLVHEDAAEFVTKEVRFEYELNIENGIPGFMAMPTNSCARDISSGHAVLYEAFSHL